MSRRARSRWACSARRSRPSPCRRSGTRQSPQVLLGGVRGAGGGAVVHGQGEQAVQDRPLRRPSVGGHGAVPGGPVRPQVPSTSEVKSSSSESWSGSRVWNDATRAIRCGWSRLSTTSWAKAPRHGERIQGRFLPGTRSRWRGPPRPGAAPPPRPVVPGVGLLVAGGGGGDHPRHPHPEWPAPPERGPPPAPATARRCSCGEITWVGTCPSPRSVLGELPSPPRTSPPPPRNTGGGGRRGPAAGSATTMGSPGRMARSSKCSSMRLRTRLGPGQRLEHRCAPPPSGWPPGMSSPTVRDSR